MIKSSPPRPVVRGWRFWYERAQVLALNVVFRMLDLALLVCRPRLLVAYLSMWRAELRYNPYCWPKSFEAVRRAQAAGQSLREYMYGETPLVTGLWIFWRAGVRRTSHVYDLGAGRGRALLAARWLGARATGIELWPEHVRASAHAMRWAGAEMRNADAACTDLHTATHVFLPWTGIEPATRARWETHLATQLSGTARIIAIDYPVRIVDCATQVQLSPWFTWGPASVWIQTRGASRPPVES